MSTFAADVSYVELARFNSRLICGSIIDLFCFYTSLRFHLELRPLLGHP